MKKIVISLFFVVVSLSVVYAQTADVTVGCSPLKVQFNSNALSSYYWEFVEGNTTSTLQNPQHIFTHPGTYLVKLYEGQGNQKIGEIEIKVYPDPVIEIFADTTNGCVPFEVNFTSDITIDPDLTILSYNWVFGDGGQSSGTNPKYTFTIGGNFNVSLEIITDLVECNTIFTEENFISTSDFDVDFEADHYFDCDLPATFNFTNNTLDKIDYTYIWDFGNGITSMSYNPNPIIYEKNGVYSVKLTVVNAQGCSISKEREITVGSPVFDINPPAVVCKNELINFKNETNAKKFNWIFDEGGSTAISISKNPSMYFSTPGNKEIKLKAISGQCFSDTTFFILVEEPDASFDMDPIISCLDPVLINLDATNDDYANYFWEVSQLGINITSVANTQFNYDDRDRDSLYLHKRDTVYVKLTVTSENGCKSESEQIFVEQKPNAHFVPSIAQGCAPLNVTFNDASFSREDIVRWSYSYGDGQKKDFNTDESNSYIYDNPGEYYVQMIIENDAGCIDTSAGAWIEVGEQIIPEFELDKTEICLGESVTVNFTNNDSRIDAYHLETDDGRFNHCWKSNVATHVFNTLPGEYPVIGVTEYNGCYSTFAAAESIKVNGAKADIGYMIDCSNPNDLKLKDESTNASNLKWTIDKSIVIDDTEFTYSFDTTGIYTISLEAMDSISGCPPSFDSKEIHITNIKAKFNKLEKVCDNEVYILDASASIDVDDSCYKGYIWDIPSSIRPVETYHDTISTFFPSGENSVRLIVEDINGCKDTLVQNTQSYGIIANFELDRDEFCLPASINTTNNTTSDTTISSWSWNNNSNQKNTIFNFDENFDKDFYNFELKVKDVLGCEETKTIKLYVYNPTSSIILNPGTNFCIGDELTFSATDYTEKGSHLNYLWDFGGLGSFTERENTVKFNERGTYPLKLFYEEESSGCKDTASTVINIVNVPIADYATDVDQLDVLCYPKIINFENNSTIDGQGFVKWIIPNIPLANPTKQFQSVKLPKGIHEATLIARSYYGCADTITKSFELVGPEGQVVTDKTMICIGDEIEFKLINLDDVNQIEWDFGDGNTIEDQNPIKYTYERAIDSTNAKVLLKSVDNGCELSIDIPLNINEVIADFELVDTTIFCAGNAFINNLSIDANKYIWETPLGEIQNDENPLFVLYPQEGDYEITLTAINTINKCEDTQTKTITLDNINDFYIVPNMFTPNGDGENDYFKPVFLDEKYEGAITFKEFRVYNRWGNLVYNNENSAEGWNGDFKNSLAPTGVYGYYMELDVAGCQVIKKQGNITLMR